MQKLLIRNIFIVIFLSFCGIFSACSTKTTQKEQQSLVETKQEFPLFSADSAYYFVQQQVDFGPRVPNTKEHQNCGDYLAGELKRLGAEVFVQEMQLKQFDGKKLNARNIIGSYNVESSNRILLLSHWDSRAWSDYDSNPENHNKPVLGANDGASGVGVLLEIARQLQIKQPTVGVDIFLTDAEDQGAPRWRQTHDADSWCLGTQYWAKNPHKDGYRARFGILLDMVGASGAIFPKEGYSMRYASNIVEKVWKQAQETGYGQFLNHRTGFITDDHVPVNEIAGIPTIDIIHLTDDGFFDAWHTQDDTMKNIDKKTLQAVGQTVLNVVYGEK